VSLLDSNARSHQEVINKPEGKLATQSEYLRRVEQGLAKTSSSPKSLDDDLNVNSLDLQYVAKAFGFATPPSVNFSTGPFFPLSVFLLTSFLLDKVFQHALKPFRMVPYLHRMTDPIHHRSDPSQLRGGPHRLLGAGLSLWWALSGHYLNFMVPLYLVMNQAKLGSGECMA